MSTRIEERADLPVGGRLTLIEGDLDRIDNRIAKLYAAVTTAAIGLVTSSLLLLANLLVK